ncbi:MAG: carbohydrate-binding domain-containing protein [Proteobacteria bacterium]|nr:carbohydrate-binding domain-containing protein [Pseudomonadota bacterium]
MTHFSHRFFIPYAALICLWSLTACHKPAPAENTVDANAESAPESGCYAINLSAPESPSSIVQVKLTDGELAINVHTDNKACIELSGVFDGGVVLNNQKNVDVELRLKDAQITSDAHSGYLDLKSNDKNMGNTYTVVLNGKSTITGAADKNSKSVVSSKPNLVFTGEGSLAVIAKYKNGITSDDVVTIESGTIDIKLDRAEAARGEKYKEKGFGIKVDNGFDMRGGKLTIDGNDHITNYESRGIKVDGSDKTAYNTGKGYVKISGGELTIHTDAKALSAGWDIDEDAKTETTEDDPHPDVIISGGVIDIVTSAEPRGGRNFGPPPEMKFDENGNPIMPEFGPPPRWPDGGMMPPEMAGDGSDAGFKRRPSPNKRKDKKKAGNASSETTVSPEGIEAKRNLTITGGKIHVVAMDDGINAGETITISGGEIMVWSITNDALDANGHATITGGLTALFGTTDPDGALDADMNRNVSYSGGIVVALGGANNAPEGDGTTGTFAQIAIVESKGGFPGGPGRGPGMRRNKAPGESGNAPVPDGAGNGPTLDNKGENAPGPTGAPDGANPFNRKREISELANATISLAEPENGNAIVSLKVPETFTGGGSILVLSDKLQKGKTYRVYTNPAMEKPVSSWIHDVISTENVVVSGDKYKEVEAGVALPSPFGPGPGMPMRDKPQKNEDMNTKP